MKRKDAPQLFEIMRTTLSGKMSATPGKKEGGDASAASPQAAPPVAPSPVSPPLIVPPSEPAPEVEPATRPSGVDSMPEREPPPAAAAVAPATVQEPERSPAPPPEPEPPAPIAARPAVPPPPPPEPVFDVPPPKPRPRRKPRPFSLKPPVPTPREAGPEQRLSFSYRASLAVAAFVFVLVFAAFAIGRTATPVRPPDAKPAPPHKAAPPTGDVHRMETPREVAPKPLPPRPAPPKPKWTIRLLEYDVTQPRDREDAIRLQIEPTQRKLREGFKAETRQIEWTKGGKTFLGLFYGQWDTSDPPGIATIEANLRNLEPFGKGRKPFERTCKLMLEPSSS